MSREEVSAKINDNVRLGRNEAKASIEKLLAIERLKQKTRLFHYAPIFLGHKSNRDMLDVLTHADGWIGYSTLSWSTRRHKKSCCLRISLFYTFICSSFILYIMLRSTMDHFEYRSHSPIQ